MNDSPTCRSRGGRRRRRQHRLGRARTSTTSRRSRPTSRRGSLLTFRGGGGGPSIPGLPPGVGGGGSGHHGRRPPQPGRPAGRADAGPLLRLARRLLHRGVRGLRRAEKRVDGRSEYITRYRLEKKDPTADVSEPVKPIVFYLSREVPEKWRPYLKQGVEDWKPAFEKAGFKNAIICKDAPTQAEDPNWDPEDARYSVIRWVAEPIAERDGAARPRPALRRDHLGPHHLLARHPQAGAEVVLRAVLGRWTRAPASCPLPDELTGELLRYVVLPRGRPHARPAPQPPGQLGVHGRAAARPEVHRRSTAA